MIYWIKYKDTGRLLYNDYFSSLDDAKISLFKYENKNSKSQGELGIYDLNGQLVFEIKTVKKSKKMIKNWW